MRTFQLLQLKHFFVFMNCVRVAKKNICSQGLATSNKLAGFLLEKIQTAQKTIGHFYNRLLLFFFKIYGDNKVLGGRQKWFEGWRPLPPL